MSHKIALITGVTGQDGSYLAELLLSMGYEVHGLVRRTSSLSRWRIDHIASDAPNNRFFLHYGDLADDSSLHSIINRVQPDEVYNLAAQSHVKISFETPIGTSDVVALGTARILEALRREKPSAKFYQASSSEMFGSAPAPQNEITQLEPRSPYAVSKVYSHQLVKNYREAYGMFLCSGILFNHESPRRSENFVTRKIAIAAVQISRGQQKSLHLGNLAAVRDWGYAPEYVRAMHGMLQHSQPDDYVIGTGNAVTVSEFAEAAFAAVDLDWAKYVEVDESLYRPTEVDFLQADPTKANKILNWKPKIYGTALAELMVREESKRTRTDQMIDPFVFNKMV